MAVSPAHRVYVLHDRHGGRRRVQRGRPRLTPFKFFDPQYITAHGALEGDPRASWGFVAVAVGLSFVIYNSKDVRAPA